MNGDQHYELSERLDRHADDMWQAGDADAAAHYQESAQVHATLALAVAASGIDQALRRSQAQAEDNRFIDA